MPKTPRTTVHRLPERGAYDRATIDAILDAGIFCHVGFVQDGQPFVIPMLFARVGEKVYLHGSSASRLIRLLESGVPACVTVTHLDGLVLARSAFHQSANYRSVTLLGSARPVTSAEEKVLALRAFTERVVPGRWTEVRPPNEQELKATTVLEFDLDEASAKIRTGPPKDDPDDYDPDVWAGVIPLVQTALSPEADAVTRPGLPAAPSVLRRSTRGR